MRKDKMLGGEEEENEINLTPMLDVVFIMLIFFIVTASFIKEAGIDVDRPDAPSAESQDEQGRFSGPICFVNATRTNGNSKTCGDNRMA